jgi:hypothetical protein
MVTPSSGCTHPGTTGAPAPIAIAAATDHDRVMPRPGRERLPAGLVFRLGGAKQWEFDMEQQGGGSQAGVRERRRVRSGGHA